MGMRRTRIAIAVIALAVTVGGLPRFERSVEAGAGDIRIDSGGEGFTSRDGGTWIGDTLFDGGRTVKARQNIAGSRDDALYDSQRVGLVGYRVPAVAGTYRVTLYLAEVENAKPRQRVMDVVAEGVTAVANVDVAGAVGKNRAYTVTFTSTVNDGVLDLAFRGLAGEPAIAGVTVESVTPTGGGVGVDTATTTASAGDSGTTSTTATTVEVTSTTAAAPTTTIAPTVTTVAPTVPTTPTTTPPTSNALSWRPPQLVSPATIYVTNSTPYWLPTLDETRDYVVVLPGRPGNPQATPLNHGIGIVGGRNVVLVGGEIVLPSKSAQPDPEYRVGLKLRQQRGTVHVEGVKILNASDAINLDQRYGAVVQLQNIYAESSPDDADTFHNDLLQTWAGPAELRVDRFSGRAAFQGFFLNPDAKEFQTPAHPSPRLFDLRRVNISEPTGTSYVYGRVGSWPMSGTSLYGTHYANKLINSVYGTFPTVVNGTPPTGDFAPPSSVGSPYVSPGYVA
jgi:hypothetical protein